MVRGGIRSDWGDVDDESCEIRTEVVVPSPNVVDGNLDTFGVEYVAEINGVRVAEAERSDVEFGDAETRVELDAEMRNGTVADWWGEHIRNGEESSMRVKPRLRVDLPLSDLPLSYLGVRVPSTERTVETDALSFLNEAERRERELVGRTVFVVEGVNANWGEPDDEETPVSVEARVENPTRVPIGFSDVVCNVRMNGVDVGGGETADGVSLGPGEEKEVEMDVTVEHSSLPDWWGTHVENGEETEIVAEVYGAVDLLGGRFHVPLLSYEGTMETSVLV